MADERGKEALNVSPRLSPSVIVADAADRQG